MSIFNNTSYTNERGKTIPARISTKYKKDFLGLSIPTKNPAEAQDTVITLIPDAPSAMPQRITLSGPDSHSEYKDNSENWVPSDYQSYWIPRGREAYKNYGNQPSAWVQFKNKLGFKQNGGTMDKINYFQQGGQTQPKPSGYRFTSRTENFTPGYSIVAQYMYPTYTRQNQDGATYEGWNDFDVASGRVIYNTPTQSDTVYYNTPDSYIQGEHAFHPIGTTKNQDAAKNRFYKFAKWSKPEDNEKSKEAHRRAISGKKNGGTMDRINYFQQGGATPQQDIKAQVTALVQAAMQGDQKATQQVNQIMEAAKAGDKQAIQIAQMMEQVLKELQGQATSAKWGSKLNYIKSLKFAKGGKTCPACEKKIEMKACGGKKAKKRYFGGLV